LLFASKVCGERIGRQSPIATSANQLTWLCPVETAEFQDPRRKQSADFKRLML